ncbi:MAG: hypothetical protein L3J30_14985 [Marinosulfonomonas sp.]|nr:hypothetical protein [Marinosulfonomonas sp.]
MIRKGKCLCGAVSFTTRNLNPDCMALAGKRERLDTAATLALFGVEK